ncbi:MULTISPECIES: NmrA family NAD(P)-binding protein [unclassified Serratia (in: enterobacteria)]|uniref:NmrA family NAD(P)-binding protein n=1 Tax=unclassified Serratia (in: enterobacteria) TaxID=2647522 RepID=UPI002ED54C48|nr:NAD(P)H-binding protein [Serratia sp. C2(2)]MEE4447436.1 NAD(P)H-binding protein [Serratia sp. C2(1)]
MDNSDKTSPILVLGATGKTGSRVAARLQQQGVAIRAGHRGAAIPFDWEDSGSWQAALQDVKKLYLSFQPDLAVPGAIDTVERFCRQAVTGGVQKIVLLSGRGEDEARQAEEVVERSGADWTILRASWFMQNFSESFILDELLNGTVYLPPGEIPEPFIDADDIADAAVAALTQPGHSNTVYELTGPRLMTFEQAINEIAAASGREIHYRQVPIADYVGYLREAQLPEEMVSLLEYLFSTVLDGRNASLTDGVQRSLGRPARDFSTYAVDTATRGIWQPR